MKEKKNILKVMIGICTLLVMSFSIVLGSAQDSVINYTLSEDKQSAVIHIDVKKIIGENELVAVKDANGNNVTETDITIYENGLYKYTVIYNEIEVIENVENIEQLATDEEKIETAELDQLSEVNKSEEVKIEKTEEVSISIEGIVIEEVEESENVQESNNAQENEEKAIQEQSIQSNIKTTQDTHVELDEIYFDFDEATGTIKKFKTNIPSSSSTSHIKIPSQINGVDVKAIGESAFAYVQNVMSIILPENLEIIQERAFMSCRDLANITFPNGLKTIESLAFEKCFQLEEAIMPDSLTNLGTYSFMDCRDLRTVKFSKDLEIIPVYIFMDCSSLSSVNIPSGVKRIGECAFSNTAIWGDIVLPDGLVTLGRAAYRGTNIRSINIPEDIKVIEGDTFDECVYLEKVILPSTSKLEKISINVFSECLSLKEIHLPEGLLTIDSDAFYKCDSLVELVIPNSVTSLSGIRNCKSLKKIVLPENITYIPYFMDCPSLTEIVIPATAKSFAWNTFEGCTSLAEINIPEGIDTIGVKMFSNCKSLKNIHLPNTISGIYSQAFNGCTSLSEITIPKNVTDIEWNAFNQCALTNIKFEDPKNIVSIGNDAFANQTPIINLYCTTDGQQYIDFNQYFDDVGKLVITNGDFTNIGNGIYKANTSNVENISYEYQLIDNLPNSKLTATATFNIIPVYKVQFVSGDNMLQEMYIPEGKEISFPDIPQKEGYTGIWDETNNIVDKDTVYNVVYKPKPILSSSNQIEVKQGQQIELKDIFLFKDADGNFLNDIIFKGEVNTDIPGSYTLEYKATDKWGGSVTGTCMVIVKGQENQNQPTPDINQKPNLDHQTQDNIENISKGDTVTYPNGEKDTYPEGGIILPGLDRIIGTNDDIYVKSGTVMNNGVIKIEADGMIIYSDGREERFPNGGEYFAGADGIFGTSDDYIKRYNREITNIFANGVMTSDDMNILLWAVLSFIGITSVVMLIKKSKARSMNEEQSK